MIEQEPKKQPIDRFPVGSRVRDTQQVSHYYGQVGTVVALGHRGRYSLRVQYDSGSVDTKLGRELWLAPE